MGHNGFEIVDRETAQRQSVAEQPLSRESVTPARVRVDQTGGTGIAIDWQDGYRSAWSFGFLRHSCPCATCSEDRKAAGRASGEPPPSTQSGPFVLYQAPPRPLEVSRVGRYALRFRWNDGHESGIYSWELLRRLPSAAPAQKPQELTR